MLLHQSGKRSYSLVAFVHLVPCCSKDSAVAFAGVAYAGMALAVDVEHKPDSIVDSVAVVAPSSQAAAVDVAALAGPVAIVVQTVVVVYYRASLSTQSS